LINPESVTPNVFTTTKLRGSNPSFVMTSDGVVAIDTPQLPSRAVEWRSITESHGPIRYLINTENHVDHIFGNYYYRGSGAIVVNHLGLYERFMVPGPEIDPYDYAHEAVPADDPEGEAIFPPRDEYYKDPNKGSIVFTGDVTIRVGDHTFNCLWTPGHTPGQTTVHVPEERVAFTGDTLFSGCQTWLMTSNVDEWLAALERIRTLDVDWLVPGHGPVVTKQFLDIQRSHLMQWKTAVADAVAKGWSRDETIERVSFATEFGPVDIGQEYMLQYIQEWNAGRLWDSLTGNPPGAGMARPLDPRDPDYAAKTSAQSRRS
jgi:cyclase